MAHGPDTARQEAPRRTREAGRWGHTYAAVDLGTNNCRLLVARPERDGFRVVDAFSRIVRLGEGLVAGEALSEPAMDRTIEALSICAGKIRRNRATHVRAVATEACRRARNTAEFIERVRAETAIDLEVIDAREEAHLALIGCAPLYECPEGDDCFALMFDIGGGSTQVTWVRLLAGGPDGRTVDTEAIGSVSVPCGVVTLSESFPELEDGDGHVSHEAYRAVCGHVADTLRDFDTAHAIAEQVAKGRVQMVGTSGTVTTLTGVFLDLPRYERGKVDGQALSFAELDRARDRLLGLDRTARAAHPCIGPQRADLVVAGCAVFDALRTLWPVGALRVADRGLREGILQGLMREADAGAGERPLPLARSARASRA